MMRVQAEVIQQSSNHTPIVTFSTGSTIYLGACQHQNQPTQFPDVALVITCFGASRNPKHHEQITDNSSHPFTFNIPPAAEWIECNFSHVPHRHQALTSTLDKIRHHVQQGNNISIHCMKGTHRALSQAHLRQPIPGCTDTAQKLHVMLLELSCRFKTAHRCILFARQLFLFVLAFLLPHARYVKIESPIISARRSGARGQRPNGRNDG